VVSLYFPPRVTARNLPPVRDRSGTTLPRCLGGCGTVVSNGRLVCDGCWIHLPDRLRRGVIGWRRLGPDRKQLLILEVENLCAHERRRHR
jgi:hypothetical protein